VAKGELTHIDLVFPNVPKTPEVTKYWMQRCQAIEGIVEATANPEYGEFKTSGTQRLHINMWFTAEAKEAVKKLVSELQSFPKEQGTAAAP